MSSRYIRCGDPVQRLSVSSELTARMSRTLLLVKFGVLLQLDAVERHGRVAALGARHVDDADLSLQEFGVGGTRRVHVDPGPIGRRQHLGEVVDLNDAIGANAVGHIEPVDRLAIEGGDHDRAMHSGRHDIGGVSPA